MKTIAAILGLVIFAACATSPLGRKQFIVVPEGQMSAMGAQAFQEMKAATPTDADPATNRYVQCIVAPIAEAAKGQTGVSQWEVVVFKDPTANAFALPGGKIGVHTGILKVATTDAQLAAVLGHEVGHVIARHGAERVSQGVATQGGLAMIDAFLSGKGSSGAHTAIMTGLGLGAQVGILLPFGRTQESEADLIGLDLMARAGFDPQQSTELWKNMMKASGGGGPPEFLSTHPASQNRIDNLQAHMADALGKYNASGKRTQCQRPSF